MKRHMAIAVAVSLALGASSFSVAPASAFTKEELVQQLTNGKFRNIRVKRKVVVEPEGNGTANLVVNPGKGKFLRKKVVPQGIVAEPQPIIVAPQGNKTKRIVVQPLIVQPSGGVKKKVVHPKVIAQPKVVQPKVVKVAVEPDVVELRKLANRKIVVEERQEIAALVEDGGLPTVDMEIFFAYNSAAIEESALPGLIALGEALSDERLSGGTFLIAGHTDATGGDFYNQTLSERRASAIKSFLVHTFHIDADSLIAVGYGEEQLRDPYDPASGANRRVQVANLAAQ